MFYVKKNYFSASQGTGVVADKLQNVECHSQHRFTAFGKDFGECQTEFPKL